MLPRLALAVIVLAAVAASAHAADKPNIVYLLADDLGYGDVQALNPARGKIKTPHLDRLAAQGMTFTDAHSGSAVCTPTRYGLLTGRYAWRTRLQRGVLDGGDAPPLIAKDRLTVPALLRHHGYATAAIGKWHLGFLSERPAGPSTATADPAAAKKKSQKGEGGLPVGSRIVGGPTTRGFDYFWGCSNARTMSGLIENDRVIENLPPIEMLPRLERQAVNYIATHAAAAKAGKPFFLYRLTLRQWPAEADKPVEAVRARLRIAGQERESAVEPGTKGVVFELDLPAGKTELTTWLYNQTGAAGGAYFTEVLSL